MDRTRFELSHSVQRYKRSILTFVIALVFVTILSGCRAETQTPQHQIIPDGDAARGQRAFVDYGCHSCHVIPGIRQARGLVGPPLTDWGDRGFIAGQFDNNAENLVSWIMAPQALIPGSAMPDMGVTWQDAKDMSAYLYSLRR